MDKQDKNPLLVVAGPTASGKTGLAVALCLQTGGEVISADSMQIYRRMNIATAKPTMAERCGVPHHMIDILEPGQSFSVADYVAHAKQTIAAVHVRGRLPVVAGGTGLYISSLADNIAFSPAPSDPALRQTLRREAEERGGEYLLEQLAAFDPETAARLHPNNLGRIIRAIEIYRLSGVTMSSQLQNSRLHPSDYDLCMLGLAFADRQWLYDRIDARVDQMLANGLLQEAQEIRELGLSGTAAQAIGYKELEGYFTGQCSLQEAVENLKRETRRYAKRQLTWFRRDPRIRWLEVDRFEGPGQLVQAALQIMREHWGEKLPRLG